MDSRLILAVRIQAESEKLIGFRVLWIDAERGARLSNRIGSIVQAVKQIG
jgi:hypothetical protein